MSEKDSKRQRVDWDALQPHYEAGIRALKDIGAEFGCSDAAIIKHARTAGWTRCLKAKIQARADSKVAAALVAQERKDSPAGKLTEAVRVEVEGEVQARVRLEHRTDIRRTKQLVNRYLAALEALEIAEAPSSELLAARAAATAEGRQHVLPGIAPLKEHIASLGKLVETQRSLVTMEREAYGIAQMVPDEDDEQAIDQMEGARRVAFILARATAQLPSTVH